MRVAKTIWFKEGYTTTVEAGPMTEGEAIDLSAKLNLENKCSNVFYDLLNDTLYESYVKHNELNVLIPYHPDYTNYLESMSKPIH